MPIFEQFLDVFVKVDEGPPPAIPRTKSTLTKVCLSKTALTNFWCHILTIIFINQSWKFVLCCMLLVQTTDIILKRLINGTYHLPCFALLVLSEATAQFHSEEQELAAGTKQSSQADKADRLTNQTG
jgi:hypothetical protein